VNKTARERYNQPLKGIERRFYIGDDDLEAIAYVEFHEASIGEPREEYEMKTENGY
jgi:hypothetical protein